MNIGFEASSLASRVPTGIYRYGTNLISSIVSEINKEEGDKISLFYKISRWKERQLWWRHPQSQVRVYQGKYWPIIKDVDLIHGLDCFVPPWKGIRKFITIHDLLVVLSDDENISSRDFRLKKRHQYEISAQSADIIISVSLSTKRDIINLFDVPEDKIYVVYPGVEERFFYEDRKKSKIILDKYKLYPGYLLFVGSISGRKNTERLVRAYAESKLSKDFPLVLAGSISYRGENTIKAIRDCGIEKNVRILGYVSDEDLPSLYTNAVGFLFPTIYEGFGIPILEAMASGLPVLTSNTGAAHEISGSFAKKVDPYDIDSISEGIDSILNFSSEIIIQAKNHARSFRWERSAQEILAIYKIQ